MFNLTRSIFLFKIILISTGLALVYCEDDNYDTKTDYDSPGMLLDDQPSEKRLLVSAGMSVL